MRIYSHKGVFTMQRFTNPRDIYHGKGALEALKTLEGKRAIICVGGGSMKKFGFLDRAQKYLEEAGMTVTLFEGIEPDPSVDTVMKGAAIMQEFKPDWIVAIGGGSPIDAAKAMLNECRFGGNGKNIICEETDRILKIELELKEIKKEVENLIKTI